MYIFFISLVHSTAKLDKIEQEANLVGTMTFRNWTDSVNEDKDYFGLNKLVKEIIDGPNYKIYSDMDGVITDFDASFMKASDGIPPREYEKKFGKDTTNKSILSEENLIKDEEISE